MSPQNYRAHSIQVNETSIQSPLPEQPHDIDTQHIKHLKGEDSKLASACDNELNDLLEPSAAEAEAETPATV